MFRRKMKERSFWLLLCLVFIISGCAGSQVSTFKYDDTYEVNVPVKSEKCYDASVLLGENIERTKDVAKKVLVALDATIKEETETSIKAQRNRHIGVIVGSGGEVLTIQLEEVDLQKTFVTTATKTGFVGGAGMKPWSCQIVDEMVEMVSH